MIREHAIIKIGTCWRAPWSLMNKGYAQQRPRKVGESILLHKKYYEWLYGPVTSGFELDHTCLNKWCVNPFHLDKVTHLENVRRGLEAKGIGPSRTHCKYGHELTRDNLVVSKLKQGYRECKMCSRLRTRRYHQSLTAAQNPDMLQSAYIQITR